MSNPTHRPRLLTGVLAITAVALLSPGQIRAQEPTPKPPLAVKDWKADPECRLVFFAVLRGLYEDGVSDEVVDSIVPPDRKGKDKMKWSFVLECPLCQPAFEAFRLYQSRPTFSDGSDKSNFGDGSTIPADSGLFAEDVGVRVRALRPVMRKWVERQLRLNSLTDVQRGEWWNGMAARAQQGRTILSAHQGKDKWYDNWSGYWGCAACLGSRDAAGALRSGRPVSAEPDHGREQK